MNVNTPLDAFFDWYYAAHPVNATFIGVHSHDHRLPDYSERSADEALQAVDALCARLAEHSTSSDPAEVLDLRLAKGVLAIERWERLSSHGYLGNPCLYTGEALFGVLSLCLRPFAPAAKRAAAAVERMRAIPVLLDQARANVRCAPRGWIERAVRECDGALAFFERGVKMLAQDEGFMHPRLWEAARDAATAFRRFREHLRKDLTARATDEYACGATALTLLLREGHCVEETPEEIAAAAEERLEESERRLGERARALGAASWREALAVLADQHPGTEEYYRCFRERWEAARAAADAHGLVSWPDYPIRYLPQPRWVREAAPLIYFLPYRAPAAFDHVDVVDYLVPPVEPEMSTADQARRLRAVNHSVITLNHVIHHGGLGHHVQNWYAYHRAASRIGRVAAVDCASRIAMLCGGTMAEGWACYATDLMEEIGFLTPQERLAQEHSRLRVAARAVADVRLHTGAWTLEQVEAFYCDRVAMSPEGARAEAIKNSMFPGTALMYLVGVMGIHALRREATRLAGLSLRDFHDRLLGHGSIPVPLVARAMRAEASVGPD